MMDITRVPRTPSFVRGVLNLRGKVIPVIDLRLKFDMETKAATDKTCIIVVTVRGGRRLQTADYRHAVANGRRKIEKGRDDR